MKKFMLIIFCFASIILLTGCNQELSAAKITRDDARTGGSLSFVYDSAQQTVFIGGQDEIIQFSSEDEVKNLSEGNRVGIKVYAPDEKLDLSTASLKMNDVNYSAEDFLESVNGQLQPFFNIYPLFSEDQRQASFSVVWQENTCEQNYKIKIVDGTKFLDKDGNIK